MPWRIGRPAAEPAHIAMLSRQLRLRESGAGWSWPRGVIDGGEEPTGQGFIGGGNQHANTLRLQLRFLASGIVCRHGCRQLVIAQHADDQFGLCAAGNDRDGHSRDVAHRLLARVLRAPAFPGHDPNPLPIAPQARYGYQRRASCTVIAPVEALVGALACGTVSLLQLDITPRCEPLDGAGPQHHGPFGIKDFCPNERWCVPMPSVRAQSAELTSRRGSGVND